MSTSYMAFTIDLEEYNMQNIIINLIIVHTYLLILYKIIICISAPHNGTILILTYICKWHVLI